MASLQCTSTSTGTSTSTNAATDYQVKATYDQLAELLAINDDCTIDQTITQGEITASSLTIPSSGVTSSSTSSTTTQTTDLSKYGCASVVSRVRDIVNQANIINCTVNKSTVISGSAILAKAEIVIETIGMDPNSATGKLFTESINRFKLLKQSNPLAPNVLKLVDKMIEGLTEILKPSINISNSNFVQNVTVSKQSSCVLSEGDKTLIGNAQTKIADLIGEIVLDAHSGSLSQSSILYEKNKSVQNVTNTEINESIDKNLASVSASGVITIRSAGPIFMENVTIDQSIQATLISNTLVNTAVQKGLSAAGDILLGNTSASGTPSPTVAPTNVTMTPIPTTPVITTPVPSTPVPSTPVPSTPALTTAPTPALTTQPVSSTNNTNMQDILTNTVDVNNTKIPIYVFVIIGIVLICTCLCAARRRTY